MNAVGPEARVAYIMSRFPKITETFILYEILAGSPPHGGENARQVIASVILSEPCLPDDAPAELCRICRRGIEARSESVRRGRLRW